MKKGIGNLFVRLFVISLLTFRNFPQLYPFSEPEPPLRVTRVSGYGAARVTEPRFFLRLRLRLRLRANRFGGSGSGSGSASLLARHLPASVVGKFMNMLTIETGNTGKHAKTMTPFLGASSLV